MPYRRPGSPYYQCRRKNLPGFGDTGALSSQVKSKPIARQMERALEEVAEKALITPAYRELLGAIVERKVDLPTLLFHRNASSLDKLLRSLNDPLLHGCIARYRAAHPKMGRSKRLGFDMLEYYTSAQTRLGSLTGKRITDICLEAEQDDRKRNSVRRTMLRSISLLLRHELGNAERGRIFADVQFPAEDDTREVYLTRAEIRKLLGACTDLGYAEMGVVIRMALQTSADRGILLAGRRATGVAIGLRLRHLRIYQENETPGGLTRYSGEVFLPDTKAASRTRTVPITDGLCRELLACTAGKEPDDTVFQMTYEQLDFPWQQVRKAAGLEHVRFKDLRAQTSIHGVPASSVTMA